MAEKNRKSLKIFNTATREYEPFVPVSDGNVSMYACGPTVYNLIHIGNARPLIFFDVVKKYLQKYLGYNVTYVRNITDIDDKIIARAIEENTTTMEIAERYISEFLIDCKSLGVDEPDKSPRATEEKYIKKMKDLIKKLVENGFAYESEGNVFFDVRKDKHYGKFSRRDLDEMEIGERVDETITSLKKDPWDFSLWKPAKPGEPSWDSPWGKGRPGWHTECVVMSSDILGDQFDIHAGGVDLIFPHHENEIAQARQSGNDKFAKYWMHNEFVNIKHKKMAKSEGNVVLVKDLVKKYRKEAIRLFFLQTHYRKPINFDSELLDGCESAVDRIVRVVDIAEKLQKKENIELDPLDFNDKSNDLKNFIELSEEGMNTDFNTAFAIGEFFALVNWIEQKSNGVLHTEEKLDVIKGLNLLKHMNSYLGIIPEVKETEEKEIDKLIAQRTTFRADGMWNEADIIRDELLKKGIMIEDTKEGTRWWRKH